MRAFTAAAVQIAPVAGPLSPEAVRKNLDKCVDFTRRCVEDTGAEAVVLPETATTEFHPRLHDGGLWTWSQAARTGDRPDLRGGSRPRRPRVRGHARRGPERGVIPQLAGAHRPAGEVLGIYRKTHPFWSEHVDHGGCEVTPGTRWRCGAPTSDGSA